MRRHQFYKTIFLLFFCACIGCTENPKKADERVKKVPKAESSEKEPVIGERIKGPADITDKINGEVIFSLHDNTQVTCTDLSGDWYQVGLSMKLKNDTLAGDTLRKGTKIIVDGKITGEVFRDMYVSTYTTNEGVWAELSGFTHKDNIYPYSIIENALTSYLTKVNDRSLSAFLPFIKDFEMETNEVNKPFTSFMTYENWIDDPSPLMRIQLIFYQNRLIGVLHSRKLNLPGTKDYPLRRDFKVAFYEDVKPELRSHFIKQFNSFIIHVD